ncbi:MAG: O-methyltransferase [Chitinophagaceae bacterium]|nr:O-methyltransferase [Chitinophagaceae bacterium]
MELVNKLVQDYAERFSSPEDEVLSRIATTTASDHPHAHMLSGHIQGRFLELISRIARPTHILEIGTFTGYSAICLARGLQPGGLLHTIELREEDAATASKNFNRAGMADRILLHTGNALEIIHTLHTGWDIVFIDADKVSYPAYYRAVLPAVRAGGIIIADNVLFHGQVVQDTIKTKNARAIHAFNEMVLQDESVDKVMLTIRDGLMLILKK